MKRQPSIHITEQALVSIFKEIGFEKSGPIKWDIAGMVKKIFQLAKSKSLAHRSISVSNDKLLKKTEKLKLTSRTEAGLFSELLLLIRKKHKHRGITLIKPGDNEWLNIKEIAKLATEFSNEFSIPLKEGYKHYIEIGLSKITKYSIFRFKSLNQTIYQIYEAKMELLSDKTPDATLKCSNAYSKQVEELIGFVDFETLKLPEKKICFKRAKDDAEKMGISPIDFIKAQFHALEWKSAIPDVNQIYGMKAIERAQAYCAEKNIKSLKNKKVVDFSKIMKKPL